jgi:hypothetical protein
LTQSMRQRLRWSTRPVEVLALGLSCRPLTSLRNAAPARIR